MKMVLPSSHQTPEVLEPSEKTFHLPTPPVSSKCSPILGFGFFSVCLVRGDHLNAQLFKFLIQRVAIISLVANDPFRELNQETTLNSFGNQLYFMRRSTVHVQGDRKTRAVCNCHDLRALTPLSLPDSRPPFFAGAKEPSMNASLMSMPPRSRKSSAKVRRISSKIPPFDHVWNHRWQVWYGGYRSGRSFQGAPVRRIHKIPLRTSLGFRRDLPRGSGRSLGDGIKVSSRVHCSSVKSISHILLI